jgi:hypothetical protein
VRRFASRPKEAAMNLNINEFIEEQRKGLTELLANLRRSRVEAARSAARESAARIKALNGRVRSMARSGVRLNAVSHGAVRSLVELNADIVSAALTDASVQLERMAYTESVRDLARMQAEVLAAARQRIVDDMERAVTILKDAAGDARKAVTPVQAVEKAAPKPKATSKRKLAPKRKPAARRKSQAPVKARASAGRAPRKTGRRST